MKQYTYLLPLWGLLVCVALLWAVPRSHAQDLPSPSVNVRVAAGVPSGDFTGRVSGIEAEAGISVGAGARVPVTPLLAVYGGVQYTRFGCGECADVGIDDTATDVSAEVGGYVTLPYRVGRFAPWASAGLLAGRLQLSGGDSIWSDIGLGWSVGAGVSAPLGNNLTLTPGVYYRTYSANFEFDADLFESGSPERTVDVTHFSLGVGLSYHF